MQAFVTGSRLYGTPKPESDIDLVILTDESSVAMLAELADTNFPMKFGRLNLIAMSDKKRFRAWREAAEDCLNRDRPVEREEAVSIHKRYETKHGVEHCVGFSGQPVIVNEDILGPL